MQSLLSSYTIQILIFSTENKDPYVQKCIFPALIYIFIWTTVTSVTVPTCILGITFRHICQIKVYNAVHKPLNQKAKIKMFITIIKTALGKQQANQNLDLNLKCLVHLQTKLKFNSHRKKMSEPLNHYCTAVGTRCLIVHTCSWYWGHHCQLLWFLFEL